MISTGVEPTSRSFERMVAGGCTIDVTRGGLWIALPRGDEHGWHLMSDEDIDALFASARLHVRQCAPFWLRSRHIAPDSPAWLRERYELALAAGAVDTVRE